MPKEIDREEAIRLRDEEVKEFYESKILRDAKGKAKKGVNGKPLLEDSTYTKDGKKMGFQITLND
jgi:hypothetical protein